jgi:WD40 repeat protein
MTCASYVQCKGTDSSLLLTGCIDGCVYVWSDNVLSRVSPCHTGAIIDMWMDPSRTLLATGGEDGFVWLWDFDKEVRTMDGGAWGSGIFGCEILTISPPCWLQMMLTLLLIFGAGQEARQEGQLHV